MRECRWARRETAVISPAGYAHRGRCVPALGTGDHGTDRDYENINQPMLDLARTARIIEVGEMLDQWVDQNAMASS